MLHEVLGQLDSCHSIVLAVMGRPLLPQHPLEQLLGQIRQGGHAAGQVPAPSKPPSHANSIVTD